MGLDTGVTSTENHICNYWTVFTSFKVVVVFDNVAILVFVLVNVFACHFLEKKENRDGGKFTWPLYTHLPKYKVENLPHNVLFVFMFVCLMFVFCLKL